MWTQKLSRLAYLIFSIIIYIILGFIFVDRIVTPGFCDGPPTQYWWKEMSTPDDLSN